MYYLVYLSIADQPLNDLELKSLLKQCVHDNKKLAITGMLLYLNQRFIQVLEGDRKTIKTLFDKIVTDERHKRVTLILEGSLEKRNFENWSMGFKSLSLDEFKSLSGFESPEELFANNPIGNESHPTLVFLRLFYEKNQTDFPEIVMDQS